jgi:hypothetical protein
MKAIHHTSSVFIAAANLLNSAKHASRSTGDVFMHNAKFRSVLGRVVLSLKCHLCLREHAELLRYTSPLTDSGPRGLLSELFHSGVDLADVR